MHCRAFRVGLDFLAPGLDFLILSFKLDWQTFARWFFFLHLVQVYHTPDSFQLHEYLRSICISVQSEVSCVDQQGHCASSVRAYSGQLNNCSILCLWFAAISFVRQMSIAFWRVSVVSRRSRAWWPWSRKPVSMRLRNILSSKVPNWQIAASLRRAAKNWLKLLPAFCKREL